jgi:hypothetical protein
MFVACSKYTHNTNDNYSIHKVKYSTMNNFIRFSMSAKYQQLFMEDEHLVTQLLMVDSAIRSNFCKGMYIWQGISSLLQ